MCVWLGGRGKLSLQNARPQQDDRQTTKDAEKGKLWPHQALVWSSPEAVGQEREICSDSCRNQVRSVTDEVLTGLGFL